MKKITLFFFSFLLLTFHANSFAKSTVIPLDQLVPKKDHRQKTMIITKVINKYHYRAAPINDELSSSILDRYIKSLDPNKSFFTQKDMDSFERYRNRLDESLKKTNLEPAFEIYRLYRIRIEERINYALTLLKSDFDFTLAESYRFDRQEAPWAKDTSALNRIWRKRIKNDILSLKLTDQEPEKIIETLTKRYNGITRRSRQMDANDVFQIFINAYTYSIEPHTSYMPPRDAENFDIGMRLSLEGIGAVLRLENEYTTIQKVVKGGPAALSQELHAGDRIIGVGQEKNGEIEDVVGWRLQDVVEKIRGPKDSIVRLRILPEKSGADGPGKVITIVRNKIKLEDQAAKKRIVENISGLDKLKIGVIEVPTFYRDFQAYARGDKDFKSTTRDVRRLLLELKQEKVNGIIIDLRSNGGGSLTEATELTGLFIPTGPVVQVKKTSGHIEIEQDLNPEMVYKGPLAVLVNRSSASASEIFAGAIQDYGRGIIIGETTFGKGTVQTLIDLDRFVFLGGHNMGRLRLTMAQFFRIKGGSTQFKGVVPDIRFPTDERHAEEGERSLDNALPWAKIAATDFTLISEHNFAKYMDRHRARVLEDPGFHFLVEEEKAAHIARNRHTVALKESERKQDWEEKKQKRLKRLNNFLVSVGLPANSGDEDQDKDKTSRDLDPDAEDPERNAIRNIAINEAARILHDLILGLSQAETQPHLKGAQPLSAMVN